MPRRGAPAIPTSDQMDESIVRVELIIGYKFAKDPTLLWEALQAAGSPVRIAGDRKIVDGNKKLAALGDAVADQWLWLNLFPTSCSKGRGDTMRQQLLSNENLTRIGRLWSMEKLIVLSPGAYRASDYMVATMMEAIFGAVYLDGGMGAVGKVMVTLGLMAALQESIPEIDQVWLDSVIGTMVDNSTP